MKMPSTLVLETIDEPLDILASGIPETRDPEIAARVRLILSERNVTASRRASPEPVERQPFDMD